MNLSAVDPSNMLVSVIVTTYNWPEALRCVLLALETQSDRHFEVIVADDGSGPETKAMLTALADKISYSLNHVWQPDAGFQAAKVRNKALAAARGDYVLFLDHDSVPTAGWIAAHRRLARPGVMVSFQRINIALAAVPKVIASPDRLAFARWRDVYRFKQQQWCHRFLPSARLPLGWCRWLYARSAKGTKNYFGVWRADVIRVNGYNESYVGWGFEDTDFVLRLLQSGVRRRLGHYAGTHIFHLNHDLESRDSVDDNNELLQLTRTASALSTDFPGLNQYELQVT